MAKTKPVEVDCAKLSVIMFNLGLNPIQASVMFSFFGITEEDFVASLEASDNPADLEDAKRFRTAQALKKEGKDPRAAFEDLGIN